MQDISVLTQIRNEIEPCRSFLSQNVIDISFCLPEKEIKWKPKHTNFETMKRTQNQNAGEFNTYISNPRFPSKLATVVKDVLHSYL